MVELGCWVVEFLNLEDGMDRLVLNWIEIIEFSLMMWNRVMNCCLDDWIVHV